MEVEHGFAGALVEMARSCADASAVRDWTLAQLTRLVPFDSAIFVGPRLGDTPSTVNKAEFRHLYWNYARNPERYRRGLAKGWRAAQTLGGAYIDTDVFSAAERRNLPLYAEMMQPQNIASQIVARPLFHGRSIGLLYLCRHGTGRFRRRDLDRILRLLPIIALSHAAIDALARDHQPASPVDADPQRVLTRREREIADLVCRGLTNGEIAAVLGNRPNTVRNQLVSIFRKLEVASRAELAGLVSAAAGSPR
jgi:DNA-binding CsgD family transcriptional regulator